MASGSNSIVEVELSGNPEIDALLIGYRWSNFTLTYSFPTGPGEYSYHSIAGFEMFNPEQRAATVEIMANFNAVCGLNIIPGGVGSNIRFAEATSIDYTAVDDEPGHGPGGNNDSAEATPPQPNASYRVGDTWYNHTGYNAPVAGDFAFAAGLMHEIGHAVGLAHGHVTDTIEHEHGDHPKPMLPPNHDSQEYSIMTYRLYPGGPTVGNSNADYPQTLMMNDIAALQYLYGAYYGHRSNSSIYSWDPNTGTMSIDGVAQGAVAAGNCVFRTIWDGGGIDTYDLSNYRTDLLLDLNPGAWCTISQDQLAFLGNDGTGDRFARGNIANALLFQGDFRSLIENATGGSGDDRLVGNVVGNLLLGNPGDDALFGNEGNDRLNGGSGRDALIGGIGIDQASYVGAFVDGVRADLMFASVNTGDAAGDSYDSIENLQGTSFNDDLRGDNGDNVLEGGFGGNDQLYGRAGNDLLIGAAGDDVLEGGTGADTLDGGGGSDTATYLFAESRIVADLLFDLRFSNEGDAFGDTYVEVENITGSQFNDDLRGNEFENILAGLGGTDGFNGRGGYDTLIGGQGHDLYFLEDLAYAGEFAGNQYDKVVEELDGGIDTVFVTAIDNPDRFTTSGYTLGANVEYGQIRGAIAFNLTGNLLDNILTGNAGANVLTGLAGNDQLGGNGGIDTLVGGLGNDVYVLNDINKANTFAIAAYDTVTEAAGEGIDTVVVEALDNPDTFATIERYVLGANVDNGIVTGSLGFNLTGNDLGNGLTGNGAANVLTGLAGNDVLAGGGGIDSLVGGLGNDTYVLVDINQSSAFSLSHYDSVTEAAGEGIDTVLVEALDDPVTFSARETYTLGANVEHGQITGTLAFNLTGNALDNILTGNGAANLLDGGDGADRLSGGLGDDFLAGGRGDDIYILDDVFARSGGIVYDNVIEGAGLDGAGEGTDTVIVGWQALGPSGYTLGDNIENGVVSGTSAFNLVGNALNNSLTGNTAANILDGGAGADNLTGGLGEDIYHVDHAGDVTTEASGQGLDTVHASLDHTLAEDIENLQLVGTATRGTGNSLANTIIGNGGANILDGGLGADTMNGGAGNDIYVVDELGDVVSEAGGGGTDTIQSAVTWALASGFEKLTLTGTAAINGTGNSVNNILTGNAAANMLDGRFGSDQMAGGAGSDTYVVNAVGDVVTELRAQGTDTVKSSVSYTLGSYVEVLQLIGTGSISGTGNALNNTVAGTTGNNVLDGGAGVDKVWGGAGNDSVNGGLGNDNLYGNLGQDSFLFDTALSASTNLDRIWDFKAVDDTIVLDRSVFTGLASDGVLAASAFHTGTAAADADDRIIYDQVSGNIFYDADGVGGAAAILFAQVNAGAVLTNADFSAIA